MGHGERISDAAQNKQAERQGWQHDALRPEASRSYMDSLQHLRNNQYSLLSRQETLIDALLDALRTR